MLKKILDNKACAKCQLCCIFERYEVWETPVFTEEIKNKLLKLRPDTKFISKDGGYISESKSDDGRRRSCPHLDKRKAVFSEMKNLLIAVYGTYRIMNIEGRRAITISNICGELFNRPLSELVSFLKDGLADKIFAYADSIRKL